MCRSARLTWLTSRGVEYTFSSPTLNFGALLGITASAPLRRRRGRVHDARCAAHWRGKPRPAPARHRPVRPDVRRRRLRRRGLPVR
ncbi:hypothetical protein I553_5765 [Mycobacterium xenopi 4042]|uniref:Uncharacterized protein n=1 Tax=Mycobacterium xenopi 4042 TaxID=1299334 RepID=X7ZXD4_MYCXE|nr:hypothetical protein I553_5765 [Mycobacterium xenopi 4042]